MLQDAIFLYGIVLIFPAISRINPNCSIAMKLGNLKKKKFEIRKNMVVKTADVTWHIHSYIAYPLCNEPELRKMSIIRRSERKIKVLYFFKQSF
jgi:hypothetical protein